MGLGDAARLRSADAGRAGTVTDHADRLRADGPLLRAIRAADTSNCTQYFRDPTTRVYTHVARLTADTWTCECGTSWAAQDGSAHPW